MERAAWNDDRGVTSPRDLRCSDVDRDRVAEALRQAAGEGRLTLSELEERLAATFAARTYGDLEPITEDLPEGPYPVPQVAGYMPAWRRSTAAGLPASRSERITTVLGDERRSGRWEVPSRLDVTCLVGEVVLDFTEAIVRHREVAVHVAALLGTVTLIVPDGIDVRMDLAASVLGETKQLTGPTTQGGPVYWIRGFVVLGSVVVRPPRQRRALFGR
ncbi:MAG: DUF1707 and DUF2154 domain-containing protein [Jiangellaceae bacterium]|nr:DUF1707 and DUF2154 domain-containing protein [Jiangellaceae bacterium]